MFTWSRLLTLAVFPLFVTLNMIPKVALGPLIIVWFSYGIGTNVLITLSLCFFPILLTTVRGLKEVEPDLLDLVRSLKRSEEHTSELQSLMRISYAVFCLKKKKMTTRPH